MQLSSREASEYVLSDVKAMVTTASSELTQYDPAYQEAHSMWRFQAAEWYLFYHFLVRRELGHGTIGAKTTQWPVVGCVGGTENRAK